MNNPQLKRTISILSEHRFQCIRQNEIKEDSHINRGNIVVEFWAGPKGVVVLQHWTNETGVTTYADWPLGHTFDELEEVLK